MKLSDYVVFFFEQHSAKHVFMVTGGGCMHLVNSFGNSKKISYVCTQHEQAAAMAAESYSKLTNSFGLVLVTSGPGATNTITGVLDCWQDSTPVIFISGQSKTKQTISNSGVEGLRQFGVQEGNIIPVVSPITKFAIEVSDPSMIRYYLEKALFESLSGRRGPVWISIPLDIQSADIEPKDLKGYDCNSFIDTIKTFPTDSEISYVLELLSKSERPVIIAGHGIRLADACEQLKSLIESKSIPVVTPFLGIDNLSESCRCNIGRVGTKGTRAGNFCIQNSDLVLSIGSRLSVSVVGHNYKQFARFAKVIIVDIDCNEHKKKTINNIDRVINCDAKIFLDCLLEKQSEIKHYDSWLEKCCEWKSRYPVCLPSYEDDSKGINYYKFVDVLNNYSPSNSVVVSDAGSAFYVVSQAIKLKEQQRYVTTGGTATMGFTVPAAIGCAVARSDYAVFAVTGDGSFMQNLQELEVIKYHKFNVKLFVVNNNGYFSIHQTQKRYFNGNYIGEGPKSGISITSIEKLAQAFDIKYYKAKTVIELSNVLDVIKNNDLPCIVEIMSTTEMEIIPTNSSEMNTKGEMISKPLEDMYPFLDRNLFKSEMIIPFLNEE